MDERINKVAEMLIAGIPDFSLNEELTNITENEITKGKKIIQGEFKYYEDGLRYNRLQHLYKKNFAVGDFKECRTIIRELEILAKKKSY